MDGKFSPEIDLIETISKKINELKQIAKKYPLININLEKLENQVHGEINKQLKVPAIPKDKVYVPIHKPKIGFTLEEEKEKKEIEKELDTKNVIDLQIRKFKNEFKKWLQNLIIFLNKLKLHLNIKKIILPFTQLEVTKISSKKLNSKEILKKVLAKLKQMKQI